MNKKGLEMFSTMISVFMLIALVTAGYLLIFEPKFSGQERIIGKRACAIINLDLNSEYKKFMFEKGLEYASYNALVKFGEDGGGCKDGNLCKPNLNKFKDYVRDEYIKILKYLGTGLRDLENITINLEIEDAYFVVTADTKESLVFREETVRYEIDFGPFTKKINYDLTIYDKLYEIYHLKKECNEKERIIDDLNVTVKCDDSGDEIHINVELSTNDLLFIDPIIQFKVAKVGRLERK